MNYYLHYIGRNLYSKELFIKEAETLGVNRCLPSHYIKQLNWGDRILVANWIPKVFSQEIIAKEISLLINKKTGKIDHRKNKMGGKAEIFGYFDVRGLNLNASDEFKKELSSQLNIITTSEVNQSVNRQCGSYTIGTSYFVTDKISDIIKKAEDLEKSRNEKVKFFVAGKFYPFNATIEPTNFSRSIIQVEIKGILQSEEVLRPSLAIIRDYNLRRRIISGVGRGRKRKEIK